MTPYRESYESYTHKITKLFAKLFKEQKIEKIYIAICQGVPKNSDSIVRLKIVSKNKPDKFYRRCKVSIKTI